MDGISVFESRKGQVGYRAETVYGFASDLRNFEQFIRPGTVNSFTASRGECRFSAGMLGNVVVAISEKIEHSKIVYSGNALQVNDFSVSLNISDAGEDKSEVKVTVSAAMNPLLKMMASGPVNSFLETLISEMENFKGWDNTTTRTQPL